MPAAGNHPTKRTRFDTDTAQELPLTTPSDAADCAVIAALTANGTLQESQKAYFRELFGEFFRLRKHLKDYEDRRSKISETGHVVSSTKLNFQLKASARLQEDDKAALDALDNQVGVDLTIYQDKLKGHIDSLLKLEIKCVKSAIKKHVARSIVIISTSLAIVDPDLDDKKGCDIYQLLLDTATNDSLPLLKYSEFDDANGIYDMIFQLAQDGVASGETPTSAYRPTAGRTYAVTAESTVVLSFKNVIKALFLDSWDTFLKQETQVANLKKMKTFIANIRAKKSTEDTAMDLANLDLTNAQTVQDIIDHRVDEKTKQLAHKVKKLQLAVAKNKPRGATQPSASLKKKKDSPAPKKAPAKNVPAKAAGVANDTSKPKPTNSKKQSKKQSNQKRKNSRKTSRK